MTVSSCVVFAWPLPINPGDHFRRCLYESLERLKRIAVKEIGLPRPAHV